MKDFLKILLKGIVLSALLAWCFFAACGCSKKMSLAELHTSTDTVAVVIKTDEKKQSENKQTKETTKEKTTETKDSAIVIKGASVRDTIPKELNSPATTSSGRKVPVHYQRQDGFLKVWVDIMPDGSIVYGANADSIVIILNNLIRQWETEKIFRSDSVAQSHTSSGDTSKYRASTTVDKKEKTIKIRRIPVWVWITIAVVAILFIFLGFFKPFKGIKQ